MSALRHLNSLLVACFLSCGSAGAEMIYVNNRCGSDLNCGRSEEDRGDGLGPLRSLAAALRRVQRGDSINIANTGTAYRESVTIQGANHSGTSFAPFVIDGNGATLEGIDLVPSHLWKRVSSDRYRFTPDRLGFQQLFLDGGVLPQRPCGDRTCRECMLSSKQWCRCNGQIDFVVEKGKSVHGYNLAYAQQRVGITLYDVRNVVIHDLNVRGFQLDGINAHDNVFDCTLSEVSCRESGRSGVSVGGASRIQLVNCDLNNNGITQLNAEGWSTTYVNSSKIASNGLPLWKREERPSKWPRSAG